MITQPLNRLPTHARAADWLRERIRSGELAVGTRLPAQRDLSAALGVSRQSIQDALFELEKDGLIEILRGSQGGSFVVAKSLSPRAVRKWIESNIDELEAIIEFRLAVEKQIGILACRRRSVEDLETMQRAIDELPSGEAPRSAFRAADGKFHAALARTAGNVRLEQALRKSRSDMFIPTDSLQFEDEVDCTRREHQEIVAALKARDESAAAELVEKHIEQTRLAILRIVGVVGTS